MIFSIRQGEDTREVSTSWYNNPEEMKPFLTTIKGVWELIMERKQAGVYGRHERLTTYFLYGKIAFMADGNYGLRQAFKHDKQYPQLATLEELGDDHDIFNAITIGPSLAWPNDVSALSGQPWTVETMHDFILTEGQKEDERICYTITEHTGLLTAEAKKHLLEAFQKAGFDVTKDSFKEVPNQYGSLFYRGSWFAVTTIFGIIIIGWRKRVIECTLPEELEISCAQLIQDNVTKDTHMFHAWSYDDLGQYLKLIFDALSTKA